MKHKYKVGDRVVAYPDPFWTYKDENLEYHGEECTIIEIVRDGKYIIDGYAEDIESCYRVQFDAVDDNGDFIKLVAQEDELRLIADDVWVKQKIADMLAFPLPRDML